MNGQLGQADFDDLSAYLDGELPADRASEVERRIAADPVWARAHQELTALNAALGAWTAPAPPADMPDTLIRQILRADRRAMGLRVAGWLAGAAAAAAAVVIGFTLFRQPTQTPPQVLVQVPTEVKRSAAYDKLPEADRAQVETLIIENLGFFKNIDVVQEFETLKAIEQLEQKGT